MGEILSSKDLFGDDKSVSTSQMEDKKILSTSELTGRSLKARLLDLISMGHLYGEYGPEQEVKFTPEGAMIRKDVPTGDPGFFSDPVTAISMGGLAAARTAAGPIQRAIAGGKEALGWVTGGASEVPGIAKAGVKGAVKAVEAPNLAKLAEKRQATGVLESITPQAKLSAVPESIPSAASKAVPKATEFLESPEGSMTSGVIPQLETEIKGGLPAGNLPKYAEGSAINLEKINSTDDVKNFLNQRTKQLEESIGKRKKSWDETRSDAISLGWNISDAKKAFKQKGSFTAAEVDAMRQLNVNAVTDFFDQIKNLPADRSGYTPELRAKYLDLLDSVRTTSQMSSEAGRALNVHKRVLGNDPSFTDAMQKERILKALSGKGVKRTDDILDKLKSIDTSNPAEVNRLIYNLTKTPWEKLSDRAYELWMNGILSNPLTHIVNVSSNALTLGYTGMERVVASGIEAGRAAATKTPRELFLNEAGQDIMSFVGGVQGGINRFTNVMKKGSQSDKFDAPVSALPESIAKYMPTRALSAEDAFFKGFIEHSEIQRLAYRQARKEGLVGEELNARVGELASTPTQEMLEKAADRGKYLTYQKELGEIGRRIMGLRDVVPGLKYFVPFIKTPLNIAKFSLERTPFNLPVVIAKAAKGDLKGAELSEELAKPLLGTILATSAYMLAERGDLTGGMPKNKAEREEKLNTGWQPYSRKIGDNYVSYGRMEPLGSILGLAADFSQLKNEMTQDEQYNVAAGILGAIKNNFSDKTFMTGFANAIEGFEDPARNLPSVGKKMVGSLVPAGVAAVARANDPYIRDTRTILDNVMSRIPGLSENVEKKLTVWGDEIKREGSALERSLSPMQRSTVKGSPIENELLKLDLNIGYPARKIKGKELDAKDYWDRVRISGSGAKETLNNIVSKPGWDRLSDAVKTTVIKGIVDSYRTKAGWEATPEFETSLIQQKVSELTK